MDKNLEKVDFLCEDCFKNLNLSLEEWDQLIMGESINDTHISCDKCHKNFKKNEKIFTKKIKTNNQNLGRS